MLTLDYTQYLDKVFGCWIGKCVAGTIGAPYEGAKELFNFEYKPSLIENMLPNDDLDLQVLWLAVLEEKGVDFTSDDLAEAFFSRCPYAPGEYAYFKKNYFRGVHPPTGGWFNNNYYVEGMGCPIRSEIWACIAPGNPQLAAELSEKDGVMDHAGESVYAEQFLAAMEAAAFFESDLDALTEIGLSVVPAESEFAELVRNVQEWCKASDDWRYVRSQVIRHYGHPDCTNMFQNMGITMLSLYLGEGDLLKTTMMALNCGFDTDCTCATAGSVLGIIAGGRALMEKHDFPDQGFVLGVDAPRRSDRVFDLAEDTCAMGLYFAERLNKEVEITNAPAAPVIEPPAKPAVAISVEYDETPSIGVGETKAFVISFTNTSDCAVSGKAALSIPEGWEIDCDSSTIAIGPGETTGWLVEVSVPADLPVLQERNLMTVEFAVDGGDAITYTFGLVGASVWQVFGPFWENRVHVPEIEVGESYFKFVTGSNEDEYADNGRAYHLNTGVDLQKEYMTLDDLLNPKPASDAAYEPEIVNCHEDLVEMNELIGFQGPCAVYMVRRMISPEAREVGIQIGHTDAYKVWINGKLVSERDTADWWTAENAHIHKFPILEGENTVVVRLSRRSDHALFSMIFAKGGSCTEHWADFASVNPG